MKKIILGTAAILLSLNVAFAANFEDQSIAQVRKAANSGNADAMVELTTRHLTGRDGATEDEKQSLAWYQKAADRNHPRGMVLVGMAYHGGLLGLNKNMQKAESLYRKAANLGDAQAMFYLFQLRLEQKDEKAILWLFKSADKGYADAIQALQNMFPQFSDSELKELMKMAEEIK